MRVTPDNVVAVLDKAITEQGTEWSALKEAVNRAFGAGKVKNWLTEVRGPLQWMLNAGRVIRTQNVHKEVYVRRSAKP